MNSDDGDLKTDPVIQGLTDTTQELKDDVRGMRAMMLAMQGMLTQLTSALPTTTPPPAPSLTTTLAYPTATPDARAPLHTPLSRSPIGVIRDVEPRYSAARSLFFRPPEVAPLAPSPTVATSPTEAESHESIAALRHLRVSPPEKFEGNANERANAKLWLESVVGWMELTATSPAISEQRLILLFASQLKGTALLWYSNVRDRAAREGKVLTLQNYFDEFVQTYDGALSQLAAEQQLRTLVYKRGACKDLTSTAAEFEQLAGRLYQTAQTSRDTNRLLANLYADVIKRGDIELWSKAMDAQPLSLDEWMGAVQNAHLVIETKKAHLRETQRVDRPEVRSTYYARTPSSTSTSTYRSGSAVQVKRVGVEGDDNDNATRDEPGNEEEVQKAEVSRTTSRPATQERLGSHLTFQQRERLKELGKCWICIGRGHRAYDCDKKGKVGYPRKPTAEDLKA